MPRGIDHLVLPVRDLEATAGFYVSAGFTVTPRGLHPWGTANRLVQLRECFLELLEVTDPASIPPTIGKPGFAQFNRDFLERREGISMLVLESSDPQWDLADFRAAGLDPRDVMTFERDAVQPDGSNARVGFDLVLVDRPGGDDAGFFSCRQHRPDLFWRDAYQEHANTALTITDVTMETGDVPEMARFMAGFAGIADAAGHGAVRSVDTGRGTIRVVQGRDTTRLTGFALGCRDLNVAKACLAHADVAFHETSSGIAIDPDLFYGVAITFHQTRE